MSSDTSFISDLRTVLRGRSFRKLFAVRLSSQTGDGVFQTALASLLFFSPEHATTAPQAAAALTAGVLPYTLVGPAAGVLLDLWSRRTTLVVANLARALVVLGISALVYSGDQGLRLYAAVLLSMSLNRFFLTGLGASLPHVVPRHELVMANAVTPTSGTLAFMTGGAIAVGMRTLIGPALSTDAALLVVAGGFYALSAVLALRMSSTLLGPDLIAAGRLRAASVTTQIRGAFYDLVLGARHVWERRPAAHALAAIGAHRLAFGISSLSTLLLCRNYFNDPSEIQAGLALLTLVVAIIGAGLATAALITPIAVRWIGTGTWIVVCFASTAAIEALFVIWMNRPLLFAASFMIGLAAQGSKICVDAIVQVSVDDAFRGRSFAFYDVVFNAAFVAAAGFTVTQVPVSGYSPRVYAIIAGIYALAALGYARAIQSSPPPNPAARYDDVSPDAGPTTPATPPSPVPDPSGPRPDAVP